MKRTVLFVLCIALLAAGAYGQEKHRIHAYMNYGPAFMNSPADAHEYWYNGRTSGLGFNIPLKGNLSLMLEANYTNFKFDESGIRGLNPYNTTPTVYGGSVRYYTGSADLRYTHNFRFYPVQVYAFGGVGFFRGDGHVVQGMTIPAAGSPVQYYRFNPNESAFNSNAGIGASMQLRDRITAYAEMQYMAGFYNERTVSMIPFRAGFFIPVMLR